MKNLEMTPSWCNKCLNELELRYITDKGKKFTILYGLCKKCKTVIMLRIIKSSEAIVIKALNKKDRYKYKTTKKS